MCVYCERRTCLNKAGMRRQLKGRRKRARTFTRLCMYKRARIKRGRIRHDDKLRRQCNVPFFIYSSSEKTINRRHDRPPYQQRQPEREREGIAIARAEMELIYLISFFYFNKNRIEEENKNGKYKC